MTDARLREQAVGLTRALIAVDTSNPPGARRPPRVSLPAISRTPAWNASSPVPTPTG